MRPRVRPVAEQERVGPPRHDPQRQRGDALPAVDGKTFRNPMPAGSATRALEAVAKTGVAAFERGRPSPFRLIQARRLADAY
jgi:hypothetical protein